MEKKKDILYFKEKLRQQFPLLAVDYHIKSLGLFGSYVRKEQHEKSDLDILVEFQETPSLLEYIELENYLSDMLGVKVDLVMKNALKQRIGQRILEEVEPV